MRFAIVFILVITLFQFDYSDADVSLNRFAKHFSDDTFIYSARELTDGGYLLAGSRDVPIIVRLDSSGEVQWVRKFNPGSDLNGYFLSAIETADGGFLAVGEIGGSDTDPIIVKLNNAGKILWQRQITGALNDHLPFVIQTSDGGYLAVGVTGSFSVSGGADCFAIKLNKSGNLQWAKAFGKEGYDKFFGAVETEDGDYILAGSVDVFGTTEPVKGFVSRVDRNGKVEWQMLYTVPQPAYLELASITTGPKNTFYMGGLYTQDLLTVEPKALLIKLNGSSKILWKKTYDRGNTGMFLSIASVPDGGVIAAGEFDAIKAFVLKARSDGSAVWTKAMPGSMIFAEQAGEGFLTINQTYIGRFFHMVIRSDSSGKTDCGLLKRSSVKIGKARITRQTSNVTTADIVIHFQSPRLSVRRANVKVKNPCASSAPKESACLAIKQP